MSADNKLLHALYRDICRIRSLEELPPAASPLHSASGLRVVVIATPATL